MECSDSDLDDRVRTLELERRRIEAELALTAGEIDRRRSYLDDGHRSLKAYLRATCNYSDAEAARVGRLTAAAADVPGLAEALHHGHIGTPQANELAVAHTNRGSATGCATSPRCCSSWPNDSASASSARACSAS